MSSDQENRFIYTLGVMGYTSEKYLDLKNPTAYSSVYKVHKTLGYKKEDIKKQLLKHDGYKLHFPAPKRFRRRKVYSPFPNSTWGLDLAEIKKYSKSNYGRNYILVCIDFFDRHAWFVALKNKAADTVLDAFKTILERSGRKPERVTSDFGREFENKKFKTFCEQNNIHQFFTSSPIKCSICERLIRSLFQIISRYMTENNTKRFTTKLKDFEFLYNNSYHRSIKRTPASVTKENYWQVYDALYGKIPAKPKPTLAVGDSVLKRKDKPLFTKGYSQTFDKDVYKVIEVKHTNPPTYKIEGGAGRLDRSFYSRELLRV